REFVAALPLERVVELHVAGVEPDRDLEGPWIGAAVPDREILDLARYAAERASALRAVTFDAFSSALTAETLRAGVTAIRDALARPAGRARSGARRISGSSALASAQRMRHTPRAGSRLRTGAARAAARAGAKRPTCDGKTVTGRSLHDALLRALTSADLRLRL